MSKQARVISLANQKGGVGKTSTTVAVAMELAKEGYKVLTIDTDSQTNLTDAMLQTKYPNKDEINVDKSLINCVVDNEDLSEATINIGKNLDLIPSTFDVFYYEYYLSKNYDDDTEQTQDLKKRVDKLRPYYDFIFIDTAPSIHFMSNAAFTACTDIIMILQTQKRSLIGVQNFAKYISNMLIGNFGVNVNILGVLPVLQEKDSYIDNTIINGAKDTFGSEYIFDNPIYNMKRVKRWDLTGVTDNSKDYWDQHTLFQYKKVANEIVQRLKDKE